MKRLLPILIAACADRDESIDLATCTETETYRVTSAAVLPRMTGHDLDLDRRPDNSLGNVYRQVANLVEEQLELSRIPNERLATDADWRLTVKRCAGERVVAALTEGDLEPEQFLEDDRRRPPSYTSGDGGVQVPLGTLFDGEGLATDPGWLAGGPSVIELPGERGEELVAKVTTAFDTTLASELVLASIVPILDTHLEGTTRDGFDYDDDGIVSAGEVRDLFEIFGLFRDDLLSSREIAITVRFTASRHELSSTGR